MPSQTIPCEDCASATKRFKDRGFSVGGCVALAQRPGMCVLSFDPPAETAGIVTMAASAAPSDAANSVSVLAGTAAPPVALDPKQGPVLTQTQVRTAQAIVNLFETGQIQGEYGQVTLLAGDPGRLTYGRSQTTLGSGNLLKMLRQYAQNPGARFRSRVEAWLPLFVANDARLDRNSKLHNLLRACADDPVMRETQDAFFDEAYWQPALAAAISLGLSSPLAVAVVYDSFVHGSWKLVRGRVDQALGKVSVVGERAWIASYVQTRRAWLAHHELSVLHNTVYRMDAFQRLIDIGQWGMGLPIVVRQAEISMGALNAPPPSCYEGPAPGSRILALQQPLARGLDVRLVQLALSDLGAEIKADGVFGQASQNCIKETQIARGLPVTGVADVELIGQLVR